MTMQMAHLLIWFKAGEAYATGLAKLPEAFAYEGEVFRAITEYLGDADYLRDRQKQLVGFSYILGDEGEHQEAICETLLSQSKIVSRQDGMMVILFRSVAFDIECVQAVGSQLYRSLTNGFMLAIPNWDFGTLGFELTNNNIPVECNGAVNRPTTTS